MQQLSLSYDIAGHHLFDEQYLKRYLENEIEKNISLFLTDNSASMLSIRKQGGSLVIRLNNIFLSAGTNVLEEIVSLVKNKNKKTPNIRKFIKQNTHLLKRKTPVKTTIRTKGKYSDLLEIYASLNSEYFNGNVSSSITWGRSCLRRAARKRTLGSYNIHNNMIRINPLLDTKKVPRFFLEFVVYHEMLHADIGVGIGPAGNSSPFPHDGPSPAFGPEILSSSSQLRTEELSNSARRTIHSKEFRRRETIYKHYHKAMEWEKNIWG